MSNGKLILRSVGICASFFLSSASVYAQSSVTLFGVVDIGIAYSTKQLDLQTGRNAGSAVQVLSSGSTVSRWGLKGVEDLGGGLKVRFDLESAFSPGNGGIGISNGEFFGDQAWVSVDGAFGEVKAGLQWSPFFTALFYTDPRTTTFGSGGVLLASYVGATSLFNANAVTYTTPVFHSLQGSAMLALGGQAGDFSAGRQYSASLKYDDGTLLLYGAFYEGNGGGTVKTPIPSNVQFEGRLIGTAYRFSTVIAKISFINYKIAGSFNNRVYGGGLQWYVKPQLDLNFGAWIVSDRNNTKNHTLLCAIGTDYFISKSTALYAQAGLLNNHGTLDSGLAISVNPNFLYGGPGTTLSTIVGIRHSF